MGLHWAPLSPLKWIHWLKVKHPVTGTAFPRFDWQWDGITLGTLQIIHLKIYPIEGENPAIGKTSHLWIGNLSIYTQGNPLVTRNTKPVWIQHFLTAPSTMEDMIVLLHLSSLTAGQTPKPSFDFSGRLFWIRHFGSRHLQLHDCALAKGSKSRRAVRQRQGGACQQAINLKYLWWEGKSFDKIIVYCTMGRPITFNETWGKRN